MSDWFDTPLGRCVLREEQRRCAELTPSIYYPSALQVGRPAADFLRGIEAGQRFLVVGRGEVGPVNGSTDAAATGDGDAPAPPHRIIAKPEALPFSDKAHNLIVLPHTLELCDDPRAALREAAQIVAAQGCVVITGFNPLSLWAALRPLMRAFGRRTWRGVPVRAGRVQDWLAALGFELAGAAMLAYRPPLQSVQRRRKLAWLEHAGARWWPTLGAVYVIVARRRQPARTGQAPARVPWRWLPGLAQPATRNATPAAAASPAAAAKSATQAATQSATRAAAPPRPSR